MLVDTGSLCVARLRSTKARRALPGQKARRAGEA